MPEGTTIWEAAKDAGIEIPVLCHDERYDPVGVCRMCVVDVGARVYAAACVRPCEDGMEVKTATPELERNRAQLTELLLVDQPPSTRTRRRRRRPTTSCSCSCAATASQQDEAESPRGQGRGEDLSNPVIAVNHDACILCDRCVRACDDIQGNDVIGRSGKGYTTRIAFDLERPDGRVVVRDLRRVRRRLPDRRAHQQADQRTSRSARARSCARSNGVPVLRRRLRADLQRRRRAQGDRLRRGPRAAGLAEPPVRQGPLRLGLLVLPAAPDHAAHPRASRATPRAR